MDNTFDLVRQYCEERGYSVAVIKGGTEYLMNHWERTVIAIAAEEPQYVDDYLNDMDTRQILDESYSSYPSQQAQVAPTST